MSSIDELLAGLVGDPPTLPSKYFYDEAGMAHYEAICRTPEYYPTRTEEAILARHAPELIARFRPRELMELGSGPSRKIRSFLDAMGGEGRSTQVDLSEGVLDSGVRDLRTAYPQLDARGVVADFSGDLGALGPGGGRMLLFLAGTVGNLHPRDVPAFLRRVRAILADGDVMVLGVDLVKEAGLLRAAYNDSAGHTAAFNRNLLHVVNRRFGATFTPEEFDHVAVWDADRAWIEMRLEANTFTVATIPGVGWSRRFEPGEWVRTEISAKYTRASVDAALLGTGLVLVDWLTDPKAWFADAVLQARPG